MRAKKSSRRSVAVTDFNCGLQLPRGLTRAEALRRAVRRKSKAMDFRGFKYDKKTGLAVLT